MISTPSLTSPRHILRRAAVAAGALLALAAPAVAQNYEGPHQVRVGAFLQGGSTTLTGTLGSLIEDGRFGNNGAGITAGLEFIRQGWIFGVEGDFGLAKGAKTIDGARFATDYFASLRGRVGVYAHPSWLIYGTGGFGFRGVTVTEPLAGLTAGQTLTGAVYGGGTELHRGNTVFFAEYLHSNFNDANVTLSNGNVFGVKGNSDAVRLGVKFKVGFDGYYDEVRDGLRK